MTIKTIQWNIGGGRIRNEKSDPASENSYSIENLDYFIDFFKKTNLDIITLQEAHAKKNQVQAEIIAEKLGYYYINDIYADSHLDKTQKLCQSIISRFPIHDQKFEFYIFPKFELIRPDGGKWISHPKGVSTSTIQIEEKWLEVKTTHLIPFRKFNIDPLSIELAEPRQDMIEKLQFDSSHGLLQGDFNYDNISLKDLIGKFLHNEVREIPQLEPTTPKNRTYDHIIYKNLELIKSEVNETFTDHYPIISQFEL